MNLIIALLLIFGISNAIAQTKSEQKVIELLDQQKVDWNKGDIPAFMEGYWKSDQLQFIGRSGITYGWENTKNNYLKACPNKEKMGQLEFQLSNITQQSRKIITVTGKFILELGVDQKLDGHFLLVVKKIKGKWKIIMDHTS